ncbi:hypothetical protein SARC_10550 [Sphaeroforma arctica JP610]|uniref:Uncharacterized protein n=1 Tax=Sphaeroforma arctica JP610 TaxID=667725 RepID=A0A0L0FJL6_9EUKA|nr:hypothetical protein, variant [Sphaeroforma arctica JP610]XP_014150877.1 hypothetical protein SARC_10550 [Sphaeroforma arctica JP610]KNC76974.1 hypothetical protein, variant [Sphaeroforma arctica JP610]KNC76975.1 hypothetical protein SARC_10550 [Sphaeroforma arctica JP610]|eukprot:XP_014150876.1 hypothetical protein, variant [Sphaeroforma arctica JP610]
MADQLQKLQKDKPYRHVSVDFISPGEDKLPSSDDTKFNLKKMPSEQFTNKNISKVESEPQPRFGKASQIRYGSQLSTGDGSVKVPGVKEVDNADMKKPAKVLVIDTDADTGVQMDEDGLPQQKTFGHMQLSQGADEHYNRLRNSPNLGSPRGTTQPSVPSVTGPVKKSIRSHKSEQVCSRQI